MSIIFSVSCIELCLKIKVVCCVSGVISPLLANILLDDLDRELEKRGHRFVRYADDFIIMVKSLSAGQRVMDSIRRFLERELRLTVNEKKSR